jgi:hypothetical protein
METLTIYPGTNDQRNLEWAQGIIQRADYTDDLKGATLERIYKLKSGVRLFAYTMPPGDDPHRTKAVVWFTAREICLVYGATFMAAIWFAQAHCDMPATVFPNGRRDGDKPMESYMTRRDIGNLRQLGRHLARKDKQKVMATMLEEQAAFEALIGTSEWSKRHAEIVKRDSEIRKFVYSRMPKFCVDLATRLINNELKFPMDWKRSLQHGGHFDYDLTINWMRAIMPQYVEGKQL